MRGMAFAIGRGSVRWCTADGSRKELQAKALQYFNDRQFVDAAKLWQSIASDKSVSPAEASLTLNNWACALGELGMHEAKRTVLESAVAHVSNTFGAQHPQTAIALYNLALVFGELGQPRRELEFLSQSLDIHEKCFHPKHVKVARVLLSIAEAHGALKNFDRQLEVMLRAQPIIERHCGPKHQQTLLAAIQLSRAYANKGELRKCQDLLRGVLATQEATLADAHPQLAITLLESAECHRQLDELVVAQAHAERAIRIQQRAFGGDHLHLVQSFVIMGSICKDGGRLKDAAEWFKGAVDLSKKRQGEKHVQYGSALVRWMEVRQLLGEPLAALADSLSAATAALANCDDDHPDKQLLRRFQQGENNP